MPKWAGSPTATGPSRSHLPQSFVVCFPPSQLPSPYGTPSSQGTSQSPDNLSGCHCKIRVTVWAGPGPPHPSCAWPFLLHSEQSLCAQQPCRPVTLKFCCFFVLFKYGMPSFYLTKHNAFLPSTPEFLILCTPILLSSDHLLHPQATKSHCHKQSQQP